MKDETDPKALACLARAVADLWKIDRDTRRPSADVTVQETTSRFFERLPDVQVVELPPADHPAPEMTPLQVVV